MSLEDWRAAIRQVESSGNYSALGPVITNKKSRYYGDRAYGAYQVMGRNIPQWTKEALGRSMTPQEFLRNRDAQDMVFTHRFGGDMKRTGSGRDAASIWHSGRTLAAAAKAGASDGYMRTQDYVAKAEAYATGKKSPGRVASLPVTDPKEGGAASSMQLLAEGSMQPSTATDYNFVKVLDSLRAMSQQTGFSGSQRPAMMDPPSKIRATTPLKSSVM